MAWPTTDDPRTNFVTVRFTDNEVDEMDTYLGGSRSNAVRDAVAEKVVREKRKRHKKKLSGGDEVDDDLEGIEVDL
jgi:metal-responsive CopG/Arc/MetJ family transcriptional regulator